MRRLLLVMGCAAVLSACASHSTEETAAAPAELAADRVFGVVAQQLPVQNYGDGPACVALVVAEPRGRSVAYVSRPAGAACALLPFTAGVPFSLSNAQTAEYEVAATAAIR